MSVLPSYEKIWRKEAAKVVASLREAKAPLTSAELGFQNRNLKVILRYVELEQGERIEKIDVIREVIGEDGLRQEVLKKAYQIISETASPKRCLAALLRNVDSREFTSPQDRESYHLAKLTILGILERNE